MSRERLLQLSGWSKTGRISTRFKSSLVPTVRTVKLTYKPLPDGHLRTYFSRSKFTAIAAVSLEQWAPDVMDQGQTGSCEGHMHACCVTTAFAAASQPLGFVASPAELYRNGRAVDRVPLPSGSFDPLQDEGAYTSSVTRGMQMTGVRAMGPMAPDGRYSDVDPVTINDEPTLADVEVERKKIPFGERAIQDCSDGRSVSNVMFDIRAALGENYPVGFGTYVDSKFMNWTPNQGPFGACDLSDPQGGGHALSILGNLTDATFLVRNSWSSDWGQNGNIVVTSDFIQQITDITVFVPELSK